MWKIKWLRVGFKDSHDKELRQKTFRETESGHNQPTNSLGARPECQLNPPPNLSTRIPKIKLCMLLPSPSLSNEFHRKNSVYISCNTRQQVPVPFMAISEWAIRPSDCCAVTGFKLNTCFYLSFATGVQAGGHFECLWFLSFGIQRIRGKSGQQIGDVCIRRSSLQRFLFFRPIRLSCFFYILYPFYFYFLRQLHVQAIHWMNSIRRQYFPVHLLITW